MTTPTDAATFIWGDKVNISGLEVEVINWFDDVVTADNIKNNLKSAMITYNVPLCYREVECITPRYKPSLLLLYENSSCQAKVLLGIHIRDKQLLSMPSGIHVHVYRN